MKNFTLVFFTLFFSFYAFSQKALPNIDLSSIDGNDVKLIDEVNKDGLTVVSLWATWCVPCIKKLDAISEVYGDWQDEANVTLIAVSLDDSRTMKRVKPMVNGKGWDYKVLLDINSDLKRALSVSNIPLTVILKSNKVVYAHVGYSPGSEDDLFEKITELSK